MGGDERERDYNQNCLSKVDGQVETHKWSVLSAERWKKTPVWRSHKQGYVLDSGGFTLTLVFSGSGAVGSALHLGCRGRRFESSLPDELKKV